MIFWENVEESCIYQNTYGVAKWQKGQVDSKQVRIKWQKGQVDSKKVSIKWQKGQVDSKKVSIKWQKGQVDSKQVSIKCYGFQFSGCWLILSVYIIMSFDFPFARLFGVR